MRPPALFLTQTGAWNAVRSYNEQMPSLRETFLLDPEIVFLNHGSFGATPEPVFREYQHWQRELERQPVEFLDRRHNELMRAARTALARYLGTEAEDLVYAQNATIAVNIVARSLDLGPGDEVLASDHEYGACDRAWRFLSAERGFSYINRPIPIPPGSAGGLAAEFWNGVNARTRLIFLSHITSPTAMLFPISEICERARVAGILTLIDGAHAPGQIPLNLTDTGADFYAGNLHKWLCAPKGTGFLYARPQVQHLLKPLVVSWGYESRSPSRSTFIDHHEWWGTRDIAAFLSVEAAIRFQAEHEWTEVRAGCHELLRSALRGVEEITGLPALYADDSWYAQMAVAAFPVQSNVLQLKLRLYDEYKVEAPIYEWKGRKLLRISVQGYNTRVDIDRLLAALSKLL